MSWTDKDTGMRFYFRDGIKVPSVTSVLDAIPEPWLWEWKTKEAVAQALDELEPEELYTKSGKQRVAKNAASHSAELARELGTWLHTTAEAHLMNMPAPEPPMEQLGPATKLRSNLMQWFEEISPFNIVAIEHEVHGDLYHEELERNMPYAGTIDLVLDFNGLRWLVDLKTSRKVSDTYIAQCAAYASAWNAECRISGGDPIQRIMVARLSKLHAGEIETVVPDRQQAKLGLEIFRAALTVTHIRMGTWGDVTGDDSSY